MIVHILTLFPEVIEGYTGASVLGKARDRGLLDVRVTQIRDFALDRHHTVDDTPYGGGAGMIMKADVVHRAMEAVRSTFRGPDVPVILTSPAGRVFNHDIAQELAAREEICVICGHYGGVDQRVRDHIATDEISVGDYVVTGGELPALIILDAAARLIPGVLGNEDSPRCDSFADGLLGAPVYTRPMKFNGWVTPNILLSGNHPEVDAWRRRERLRETHARRPELLEHADLNAADRKFLASLVNGN